MAKAPDNPSKKKKRERKKREVTTVSNEVISAKQLELATKMATSLEAREAVFEHDTQYPIDSLADYFTNIQEGAKRILPKEKQQLHHSLETQRNNRLVLDQHQVLVLALTLGST